MAAKRISSGLPFLFLLTLVFTNVAYGQIEWREPEISKEQLPNENRKIVRFSGNTKSGAQVRIRGEKIKMYLDDGSSKTASIVQKNKVQFPIKADDNGDFSFELYLPTGAVDIPVEIYNGDKWVLSSLNFRVPTEGELDDFDVNEEDEGQALESFEAEAEMEERLKRTSSEYNREEDRGQVIRRRGEDHILERHDVRAFFGLGFAYANATEQAGSPVIGGGTLDMDESDIVFPSYRFGAMYRYHQIWKFDFDYRSTSVSLDPENIPAGSKNVADRTWSNFRLNSSWLKWELPFGSWGIDAGFQFQSVPYLKLPEGSAIYSFSNNSIFYLHGGIRIESDREDRKWPWEAYARLLYGLSAGSAFDMESGYAFDLGGGVSRELIPNFEVGAFGEFQYQIYDSKFTESGTTYKNDFNLMLLTLEGRLTMRF